MNYRATKGKNLSYIRALAVCFHTLLTLMLPRESVVTPHPKRRLNLANGAKHLSFEDLFEALGLKS
jgi:hypothetical protein